MTDAAFLPLSISSVVERLLSEGWSIEEDRRLRGRCSRVTNWRHRKNGKLRQETWSALLAVRFTGDVPEWFDEISPHALTFDDLQAVVAADIPVAERVEACIQTGIFYIDRPLDDTYTQWLSDRLDDRAELQLATLELLRTLQAPILLPKLESLAAEGTLYVQQLATQVLADLMLIA